MKGLVWILAVLSIASIAFVAGIAILGRSESLAIQALQTPHFPIGVQRQEVELVFRNTGLGTVTFVNPNSECCGMPDRRLIELKPGETARISVPLDLRQHRVSSDRLRKRILYTTPLMSGMAIAEIPYTHEG